ncbi:hypothetical protein FACS1894161_2190 [Spirochaetia bacterium]|nr:hypothetical protein FACS1894161_2190 [Spirochaetia bacterium]
MKDKILLSYFFVFLFLMSAAAQGQTRRVPLDVYVIIDSSTAMGRGKNEAVSWVCDAVLGGTVQNGDRLNLWTAGEKPALLYSGEISADTREDAKKLVRNIRFQDGSADYRGALNQARTQILAGTEYSGRSADGRLSYTLLVSGANPKDPPVKEAESAGLLMYSRVENFSGWRVLTVGLDVGVKVRQNTSTYMKNR